MKNDHSVRVSMSSFVTFYQIIGHLDFIHLATYLSIFIQRKNSTSNNNFDRPLFKYDGISSQFLTYLISCSFLLILYNAFATCVHMPNTRRFSGGLTLFLCKKKKKKRLPITCL